MPSILFNYRIHLTKLIQHFLSRSFIQSFSSWDYRTPIMKWARLHLYLHGKSSTAGRNRRWAIPILWISFLAPSALFYLHWFAITCLEDVKHHKYFVNFFPRLLLIRLMGHHFVELIELYGSTSISIQFCYHLVNSLSFCFDSKGSDCLSEFLIILWLPLGSIEPPWSRSNRSKTILSYITSYRETKGLTYGVGSKTYFDI